MALTPFRWIALAAIGCMLVFFSLVEKEPSETEYSRFRDARMARLDSVEQRLASQAFASQQAAERLARRYRLLQLMDSLKRVTARSADTGAMRIFIDAGYPAPMHALIDSMIRRARGMKPGNSGIGVDVYAVADMAPAVRGVGRYLLTTAEVRYELPVERGGRCRVYLRTGNLRYGEVVRTLRTQVAAEQLLGPCAFYAAFGEPGPLVRDWLFAGGWAYTTEGSWSSPGDHGFRNDDDPTVVFQGPSRALYYFRPDSKAPPCIMGDLAACAAISQVSGRSALTRSVGSYTSPLDLGRGRYFRLGLGVYGGEFLSDVVQEAGHERFKAFWTSPDSVPIAYAAASGKSWEQEVHEWMVSKYGKIEAGPRVTGYALLMSILLVTGAIVVVFRSSLSRRYA
jgi:hypothetical protein